MNKRLVAGFVLSLCAAAAQAQSFSFGLWGDMPYRKSGDMVKMPALLRSINASDISFSIYDGDIKDGSSPCSDDVYTQALQMFAQMRKPVVYVPGDNEWTDCHRKTNDGYDPLERLDHLRKVMIPSTRSLGQQQMELTRQGKLGEKFVENTRFNHRDIEFLTLNLPGSNNNLVLDAKECSNKSVRTPSQCEAANAEHAERDAANIAWLREGFAKASASKARGIVVVMQADPGFDLPETEEIDESRAPGVSGYRRFVEALVAETERFAGQVLLVHGDTHFFKVDKPLYSPTKLLSNLTRVQTFGSPSIHWVRIVVEPTTQHVFNIVPVIVQQ
ncbi:MAG: hypothetical protein RLZZ555_148 [Pseudomonadota bacterium]|jgi:hypothetical protein